jgi:Flp pilus assembly pilin Flp
MHDERGQTTTEYGLILMIVSVAVIAIMLVGAGSLTELYQDTGSVVHAAVEKVISA